MRQSPPLTPDAAGANWVESRNWSGLAGQNSGGPARPRPWSPPPRGGLVPMRPLRFFEVLDGGFRLMRHNPRLTIGVSVIAYTLWVLFAGGLLAGIIYVSSGADVLSSDDSDGLGLLFLTNSAATIVSLGSLPLCQILAAIVAVSADADRRGERLGAVGAWRRLRPFAFRLLALLFAVIAMQVLALAIVCLPGILALFVDPVIASLLIAVGSVLWVVPVLLIVVRFYQAAPALVTEDLGVFASLKRSWVLSRGVFWRVTGIDLCAYVLGSTVVSIIATPLIVILMIVATIVTFAFTDLETVLTVFFLIYAAIAILLSTVVNGLLYAYFSSILALNYLDGRMRGEGYDLILLREAEAA